MGSGGGGGGMSGLGFTKGGTVTSADMDFAPSSSTPGLGMSAGLGFTPAGGGGGRREGLGGLGAGGNDDRMAEAEEDDSDEELLPSTFGQR